MPTGHNDDEPLVKHTWPALHAPAHCGDTCPGTDENFPTAHVPEHDAFVRPGVLPYSPTLQFTHAAKPPVLYWPG